MEALLIILFLFFFIIGIIMFVGMFFAAIKVSLEKKRLPHKGLWRKMNEDHIPTRDIVLLIIIMIMIFIGLYVIGNTPHALKINNIGSKSNNIDRGFSSNYIIKVSGTSDTKFSGSYYIVTSSGSISKSIGGYIPDEFAVSGDLISVCFQKQEEDGLMRVEIITGKKPVLSSYTSAPYGVVTIASTK